MTALEVLEAVRTRNIQLTVRGDRLAIRYPDGVFTPELHDQIRDQKPALIALLSPDRFVTLKGGLTIPVPALLLALDLEARGIPLAVDAAGDFVIPTDPRLLPGDRAAMGRWRLHLAAIVAYRVPDKELPQ